MGLFNKGGADKALKEILKARRYHRLGHIGEGGIAQVSSIFDAYLNRVVAIKALKSETAENPDVVTSFINEAKMIGYLDHPGVVSILDTFVLEENRLSYSMRFVPGCSLEYELKNVNPQGPAAKPLAQSLKIFSNLCETLAYVHDKGVIHLDIKPENIMLGPYGEVMIMDWGNARLYDERPYREYIQAFSAGAQVVEFVKEREDVILGTPGYMSPEQTNNARSDLGPGSDIFSLGIIFYRMLTGVHPFPATTAPEAMDNIRHAIPAPPHAVNPEVPRRLSQICLKMLEKKIDNRYASFHDILLDLHEFADSGQAFATKAFQPGETICREGDAGEFAFTILDGKVEVSKISEGRAKVLAHLGKGEIVGELAVFTRMPRTATVTALEPTTIRIMKKEEVDQELEKLSPWVGAMIAGLSHRFSQLNEKILRMTDDR